MMKYVRDNFKTLLSLSVIFSGGIAKADLYLHIPRGGQNTVQFACSNAAAASTWCATKKPETLVTITSVNNVINQVRCDDMVTGYQQSDCSQTE
jgi:hypothetical protein